MALTKTLKSLPGISAFVAKFLGYDQQDDTAGTGTTQAAATALSGSIVHVETATAGANDSVRLPAIAAVKHLPILVRNDSGATINIYPATGESINDGAADAAITLADNGFAVFAPVTDSKWIGG